MILVTGAAGFIGMHVARLLLERGEQVCGLDNLNDYYDPQLKLARLEQLAPYPNFRFFKAEIADGDALHGLLRQCMPTHVVHLAAQAGVRYSLEKPQAYVQSNLVGFANVLEACRHNRVQHLVYASSSSVYGANSKMPFSVADNVDHPVSLYAATKKSNELMAHAYSHLYRIPTTGLRFFTVYGPWGRPDMSPWLFTRAIVAGEPIKVFNYGNMKRDFTYIDDIAQGTVRVMDRPPEVDSACPPYRVYNIGNHQPVALLDFIGTLERSLGKQSQKVLMPMQAGDVPATYADVEDLKRDTGFSPATTLAEGLHKWAEWYQKYSALGGYPGGAP
jgi:UDP-glucuronate 4-epimerase